MTLQRRPVLILGASTRAAAYSALRAGLQPICADLFADEDLRAVADVERVADHPHGLLAAARNVPVCPWMYTGALENHPELVAAISAERPLWGAGADVLRCIRDPLRVQEVLARGDLPSLEVRPSSDPPPPDGRWLIKPHRGAAGRRIAPWTESAAAGNPWDEEHHFQQRAVGKPMSAVFVASEKTTEFVGVTRQLVGVRGLGAAEFGYCGSIGPAKLGRAATDQLRQAGDLLARDAGLRGLFGVDFLHQTAASRVWVTEVNPRYTASVEVLELAHGMSLLEEHRRACCESDRLVAGTSGETGQCSGPGSWSGRSPLRIVGKVVLFATEPTRTVGLPGWSTTASEPVPTAADVPAVGTIIDAGRPLCTVLAAGPEEAACELALERTIHEVRRQLTGRDANGVILESPTHCR